MTDEAGRQRMIPIGEATRRICGYCADPTNWKPARRHAIEHQEWVHLSAKGYNVHNLCAAAKLWDLVNEIEEP